MVRRFLQILLSCLVIVGYPAFALADEAGSAALTPLNLTGHWVGYLAIAIFAFAYVLAMLEEVTELRKSKPMVLAASLIWAFISVIYVADGMSALSGQAFRTALEGFAELFLFIMVSMAYLNAMEDRGIFENLRIWLLSKSFSYRQLFWITGWMSFFLSSVCNNLTTALLMGAVVLAMGKSNKRFVSIACVNIVVATNAGGSFSPFGDITTLLVWQKGVVPFGSFYSLLVPAMVNFALPAALMHFWVPKEQPAAAIEEPQMKRGGITMIVLFLLTIITAVCFENFLHLPPAAGMLMGLTYLKFFSYYLQKTPGQTALLNADDIDMPPDLIKKQDFDVFEKVAHLEWDTLLFFYGVMMSVAGLSFIGYLGFASNFLYDQIDPTVANILVGIFSAFIDNGTIMYAVLTMHPDISQGQWLLVTLTAGVGGSLLAIGSAAGVGLMGQAKGLYTFSSHLKWMPVILVGYFGSIGIHFLLNQRFF
ncbi:sodium:proton antiporter NhaD [Methylovulum psychrotolerans]|jgi:Na+/H+ antiporter NhaD/arsenite permease-like protein|uniref:Sodium:proton antiporter n=1 Tax=Methylovulum psychrotolerans TaxID=1704499 RepID=A0A1Z4BZY2_9GAMM|nr:sodium:proton antiporter NhaD [Methylovulum psychrotolerans]ASF46835.1 sodium:proton antiporter [Methylovulum psychrotolerans]POZ53647.1 sodium:proton antiporter [Methylovulum psychrotolerans]